jgi:hypothetical protein
VFGAAGAPVNEPPVDLKTLHAKIGQLALENDFSYGLFLQEPRAPASRTRFCLFDASDLIGNAARRLFFDDGSSSYPRIGYRISSFRRGAASLLSRRSRSRVLTKKSRGFPSSRLVPRYRSDGSILTISTGLRVTVESVSTLQTGLSIEAAAACQCPI